MTTKDLALKHIDEVARSLTNEEFERFWKMASGDKVKFIVDRYQDSKQQELNTLRSKLRSQTGREARQTRLKMLEVTKQMYE